MAQIRLAIAALTTLLAPAIASAQSSPWPCEDPAWMPGEVNASFASAPSASTVWDPDGPGPLPEVWVVAGFVYSASGVLMNNIAVWDGTWWNSLGGGLEQSSIHALLPWDGKLVAAGYLKKAGSVAVNNIAQWDPSSQTWGPIGSGLGGPNERVYALTEYADQLVAAGTFVSSGTAPVLRIAAWDGSQWTPLGAGLQPQTSTPNDVYSGRGLAALGNDLYVVGDFTKAGSVTLKSIARWNGATWSAVGLDAANFSGTLRAVEVYGGELHAAGAFESIAGVAANNIARWNGSVWSPLAGGLTSSGTAEVQRLRVALGKLHAGGVFTKADGKAVSLVAAWDGQAWSALPGKGNTTSLSLSPGVGGVDEFKGQIHLAGSIFSFYGVQCYGVMRWDGGSMWSRVAPEGFANGVSDMVEHEGEMLIVGGITKNASLERTLIGDPSGWTQFAGPTTPWSAGYAVVSTADGAIVSGSGVSGGIARWDGASWVPLGSGFQGAQFTIGLAFDLVNVDGSLYAGGKFISAGGVSAANIARWDGSAWNPLGAGVTGVGTDVSVRTLVSWQGSVVAGGRFDAAGGQPALNIARWDGTSWSPLGSGLSGGTVPVHALADWNGDLLAAGETTSVFPGGTGADIARWNPANSAWEVLATAFNTTSPAVYALRPVGSRLLVGGSFSSIDTNAIPNLVLFDGSSWGSLSGGVDGAVASIGMLGDHVCVGGFFTNVGGSTTQSAAVAWLTCPPAACPADCDASGGLNIDDFICFQTLFALGDPAADCDASGALNIDDFICFQTNFALGC